VYIRDDSSRYVTTASTPNEEFALSLKPLAYEILLSLGLKESHGWSLVKQIQRRAEGRYKVQPGSLYRTIQNLIRDGYIEETESRIDRDLDDERRRYFRLTPAGRNAILAETERLRPLVELAARLKI
jgi:DNA-binding PadR family transcriptional regulator